MTKVIGIDTGTNSLGWAIVERTEEGCKLLDKGVSIFQEGVKVEKGIESSKASERTGHKALRVRYYRIKLRKIRLLRVLSDNGFCPPLTKEELSAWRLKKVYPVKNEAFMAWQATDDKEDINPYHYRHICLTETLDLDKQVNRYILGRALYHIIQRRGFLSNRKDQSTDEEGKVKESISQLSADMAAAGYEYLGDYFYHLYGLGEKIRGKYTARNEHYLKEFRAICARQGLDAALTSRLEKTIFDQRPLKSQKGLVGKCVFEKGKSRCPVSHPLFEEYRMLCFVNNIRIQKPGGDMRPLDDEERAKAISVFYRKSKENFNFEDIAKKISGKGKYIYYKDAAKAKDLFTDRYNFHMDDSTSGCVVTARLMDIFGENWQDAVCEVYKSNDDTGNKSKLDIINDVWHALFSYDNDERLADFGKRHLQLDDDQAKAFAAIKVPRDYASLSLKAIKKMLPYLRRGLRYSHAAFLANLCEVLPSYVWDVKEMREAAIDRIIGQIDKYNPVSDGPTLEVCVKDYIKSQYGVSDEVLKKLYHPSMIETFPRVRPDDNGLYQLGSPRTSSIRNPMAMRSLFRLRKLINLLLKEGKIDSETVVNIEFARELNDANKRKALANVERGNRKSRDEARKKIIDLYKKETGRDIEPTDTDILKYQLWEEQGHICLYTGNQIGITEFLGADPKYDIEHTVPRSVGGDSTRMNLTLCDSKFNREVKKTKLPSQLDNHAEILQRVEDWKEKYEALEKQIRRLKHGSSSDKEQKDRRIQRRHELTLERDYCKGKYSRFVMTEVPEGFSRRQGTDISVISRYARLYLKSVFKHVYTVKGIATSDFRKIWGIQDEYAKKERVNHVHHCIDAIVIACIGKAEYDELARYYHNDDEFKYHRKPKPEDPEKPWPTFVEDIKAVENEILVAHYTPDNMRKQGRRRIKVNGKKVLAKGDAARGSLHNDTYYGAISEPATGEVKYVVRKALSALKEADVKNIVDDTVRNIVQTAIDEKGFKDAMAGPVWMNEDKGIQIKKVRCYTPSVTNPLNIRQQRDKSVKEYKQQYHVANDRNYLMAIYIGKDKKGREKRDFELINNLRAAEYFRTSNDKEMMGHDMVPQLSKNDYPLAFTLKIGTMVLLYEKEPEEVWETSEQERGRRLYKVTGMSSMVIGGNAYGIFTLTYHEEARQSSDVKAKNGAYVQGEQLRPAIRMLHTQVNALVEGYDFEINEIGEIKRLR